MKLRRHAKRAVARLGLDVSPHSKSFEARRRVLMEHLGIDLVIDVGANEGQYASSVRRSGYRGRIVSFEPLLEPYNKLVNRFAADAQFSGVRSAIGDHEGEVTIHHSGNSVYSSALPILADTVALAGAGAQYVTDETVPLTTLDLALAGRTETSQWLKVDVQGLERDVLSGASSTLKRARAVEIELSPAPLYDGQMLMGECLDLLSNHGYLLAAIQGVSLSDTSGRWLQFEGIFIKE